MVFKKRPLQLSQLVRLLLLMLMLSACQPPPEEPHDAQGYIKGRYRYVVANFPGILKEMYVRRGAYVVAGQPLFSIEVETQSAVSKFQEQLKQQENQRHRDQIQAALMRLTIRHREKLLQKNAATPASIADARANYEIAQARVGKDKEAIAATEAILAQASWTKKQKMVMADVSALVFNTYYVPGSQVRVNKPVVALLTPRDMQAVFFVPASWLTKLAPGKTVYITCPHCAPGLSGKVLRISHKMEYTPPALYNNETRKEPVYRVEAVLPSTLATSLHFNQKVTVKLN